MGLGKESPVISVFENDKLVGLFIDSPTTASRQPDKFDKEIVRIFKEHQEFQERIKDIEATLTNEKSVAAKAYTACGNYQERIKELEAVLENPEKWMKWCDEKILERNEELEATIEKLIEGQKAKTIAGS